MATRRLKWRKGIALSLGVTALLFGGELILRRFHFQFEPHLEFAYPRPGDFAQLRYDPDLFWTLDPARSGVNSWGFPGPEFSVDKPAGVFRILFLGDSIMQAGYPAEVQQCLQLEGFSQVETITLAVNGYSSYQGRMLAEKYGLSLKPDLVEVQYGWNDHWLAYGEGDAQKDFPPPSRWTSLFHRVYDHVAVLQALARVWDVAFRYANHPTGELRVPLDQFRENLTTIRALFENQHIPVYLVTAPSAHPQWGVPAHMIQRGFATSTQNVLQLHKQYNHATREVAREGKLVDLEASYKDFSASELETLFIQDGIHPTQEGTEQFAKMVCEGIQSAIK